MASKAERGAGASREEGADEGRALLLFVASTSDGGAPAWPAAEAKTMSLLSIASLLVVFVVSNASNDASGAIFMVIASLSREEREGLGLGEVPFLGKKKLRGRRRSFFFFSVCFLRL